MEILQFGYAFLFTRGFGKQPLILQMVTYLVTRRIDQIDPMDIGWFWSLINVDKALSKLFKVNCIKERLGKINKAWM